MPDQKFSSKFHFRFTNDEVAEMERLLKENSNVLPHTKVIKELALKFSKTRHLHGQSYVRSNSVHNWFKRRRHFVNKAKKGLSSSVTKMNLLPVQIEEKQNNDEEEASYKSASEEERSRGTFREGTPGTVVPSSSVSNSLDVVDHRDGAPQPVPFFHSSVSDVDSVLARLAKFKKVQMKVISKTSVNQSAALTNSSGERANDMVDHATSTLAKLAGISLVDFRSYQKDFDMAICILVEKGSLSDTKKTELLSLQERILNIFKENEQAREELSKCDDLSGKVTDAAESANKLMKKAVYLEEKCKQFPQDLSAASCRISELEVALLHAKAELEMKKSEQADVHNKLSKLRESLDAVNNHLMSMKAEEAHLVKKQVHAKEALAKTFEEWVQVTHAKVLFV